MVSNDTGFYKPAKVNLTEAQAKKIIRQEPVRISAGQIGTGDKVILLHPENHLKLSKAKRAGKGAVLYMSAGEVLATVESDLAGSGIFGDIWKGLKSGYKWVKKNVVDSDLYQQSIKPLVRRGVKIAEGAAKTFTGNSPEGNAAIEGIVGKIGSETGAFGMKGRSEAFAKSNNTGKRYTNYRKSDLLGSSFKLN